MSQSPFIVVRYAPGSAGRIISTILQLSDSVASWNTSLGKNNFSTENYTSYLITSFPEAPEQHLRSEPDLPYYSDFYSGTYERGENSSFKQYLQHQEDTGCEYFFENLRQRLYVNLILHKSKIPMFMQGSHMINIIIDTPAALELSQKLLWCKHYQIVNQSEIKKLAHDPTTCNQKRRHLVQQFYTGASQVMIDSLEDFYISEIIKNPVFEVFQHTSLLLQDNSNKHCDQHFFYLSNIFCKKNLLANINTICDQINLARPNEQLLSLTFDIWWNSQHKILRHCDLQ